MLAAFTTSVLFLVSYVIYHANVGSRPFAGQGPIRTVYFTILITPHHPGGRDPAVGDHHADARPSRALRPSPPIARWTLPIWLYVSVTGVVVYLMLYRM